LGFHSQSGEVPGGDANKLIGEAHRLLRLGLGSAAVRRLRRAVDRSKGENLELAKLSLAKALRLSCELDEAYEVLQSMDAEVHESSKDLILERQWEEGCLEMTRKKRCGSIVSRTLHGESHAESSYISEAIAWAYAFDDEVWRARLPTIRYLLKKSERDIKSAGFVVDALKVLEESYQESGSPFRKIQRVGKMIGSLSLIRGIDREQLVLIGAARWLAKFEQFRLASMLVAQYRANSWRLTNGRLDDHLGIATDLFGKTWFKDFLD
jgi:hypothetical protein